MTVGLTAVVTRPLHELEETWKADARLAAPPTQLVSKDCLCGGVITALNTERAITAAVASHNASTAHEQWAIRAGWR